MTSYHPAEPNASVTTRHRRPVQTVSALVGLVFLLVGVAGFVPGVTTDLDQLHVAGHDSGAMLVGLFMVSVLHNVVHLAFGVVGLLASRTARSARLFLLVGGVVYALLWVYGLVVDRDSTANVVPLNSADNWLHLVLAVGMIALGLVLGRGVTADRARV